MPPFVDYGDNALNNWACHFAAHSTQAQKESAGSEIRNRRSKSIRTTLLERIRTVVGNTVTMATHNGAGQALKLIVSQKVKPMSQNDNDKSKVPSEAEAVAIWLMLFEGHHQHDIAAALGYNQGRISEVKTRKRHPAAYDIAMTKVTKH